MLICRNLHKKSSEVSIKTSSTPPSLSFKGQATKHTTVKWSIHFNVVHDLHWPPLYFYYFYVLCNLGLDIATNTVAFATNFFSGCD